MARAKALVPFTGFQRQWVEDRSRFKGVTKSRRIGFTFATAWEIAEDISSRRTQWRIVSRTQDTAREALADVHNHLEVFGLAERKSLRIEEEETGLFFRDMKVRQFSIHLNNRSVASAMTAHPDALRGFGGNTFLDEHAFHERSEDLWKGAAAAVLRGHRLLVVSTPHYQIGNYYRLARKADAVSGRPPAQRQNGIWSWHWVDIHMAAPQMAAIGQPVDLEAMQELAGDEENWQQEFECSFLAAAEMLIPLELIAAARSGLARLDWVPDEEDDGDLYLGIDIGRKRDRTPIYIDRRIADVSICRGLITLHRTPFEEQFAVIREVLRHPRVRRACIDQTGMGLPLVERLQADPEAGWKVEGVQFTMQTKEAMALLVRRRMEERLIKIPENAPALERALAAVRREATASGNLRFDAERTDAGHADEFWALALAQFAADTRSYVPLSDGALVNDTVVGNLEAMAF